jgi:hypothetical protein
MAAHQQAIRNETFFELEALPPDLRDLTLSCHPMYGIGADVAAPTWSSPGSQRSGCIPAEPYPLLRSTPV